MPLEEGVAPNVEEQNIEERHVNISGLFRRPEKYRIGEDFDLFFRKSVVYFDAIDLTDERKKRLALLFNLSEDAFRLAEGVPLPECQNSFDAWGKEIATRFEKIKRQLRGDIPLVREFNCQEKLWMPIQCL